MMRKAFLSLLFVTVLAAAAAELSNRDILTAQWFPFGHDLAATARDRAERLKDLEELYLKSGVYNPVNAAYWACDPKAHDQAGTAKAECAHHTANVHGRDPLKAASYYCDGLHNPAGPYGTRCACGGKRRHHYNEAREMRRDFCENVLHLNGVHEDYFGCIKLPVWAGDRNSTAEDIEKCGVNWPESG
jgi:hypothetical protein